MALNQTNAFGAADAPGGTEYTELGGVESAPGRNALDFVGLFTTMTITKKHKEYLDAVVEIAKSKLPNLVREQLPEPSGAQAFIVTDETGQKYALNLLFKDLIAPSAELIPLSFKAKVAADALQRKSPGISLINTIIVGDRDLDRVQQMAIALVASLSIQVSAEYRDAGARDLSVNNEFVVDNNIEAARNFIDRTSPTGVLPYFDLGFTIGVRRKSKNAWANNNPYTRYVQDNQPEPFMAVGAMVDIKGPFPDPTTGVQKYQPVIRITAMPSLIPLMGSVFLAQVLAAQNFIQFGTWKRPFMKFSKGSPNLGNLTPDPDGSGKLWFAPDIQSMETFIAQWCYPPILCMDITEGTIRIPSLYAFTDASAQNQQALLNEAARFFGQPLPMFNGTPYTPVATDYIGTVGPAEGVQLDSRKITYLNQAAEGALDANTARVLLNFFPDPLERARTIAQLSGSFVSLYQDTVVSVNGAFLSAVSQILPNSGLTVFDPTGQGGVVPLSGFSPQYGNYTGFMPVATMSQQRPIYGTNGLYSVL